MAGIKHNPTVFIGAITLLELATTFWLAIQFGVRTYALFLILTGVGLAIQWLRWKRIKTLWLKIANIHEQHKHLVGTAWAETVAGVPNYSAMCREVNVFWVCTGLFLFPGFITNMIAFALMLPPVRKRLHI